mmetsp:Transcript_15930/g.49872  ORF Transcript_15930/g.49872 Transcript_15930/m.49872 type:complete len:294 (+) Transcript_15930:705-1586(+)
MRRHTVAAPASRALGGLPSVHTPSDAQDLLAALHNGRGQALQRSLRGLSDGHQRHQHGVAARRLWHSTEAGAAEPAPARALVEGPGLRLRPRRGQRSLQGALRGLRVQVAACDGYRHGRPCRVQAQVQAAAKEEAELRAAVEGKGTGRGHRRAQDRLIEAVLCEAPSEEPVLLADLRLVGQVLEGATTALLPEVLAGRCHLVQRGRAALLYDEPELSSLLLFEAVALGEADPEVQLFPGQCTLKGKLELLLVLPHVDSDLAPAVVIDLAYGHATKELVTAEVVDDNHMVAKGA